MNTIMLITNDVIHIDLYFPPLFLQLLLVFIPTPELNDIKIIAIIAMIRMFNVGESMDCIA